MIREGSKGTNDPAAANWDRIFGKKRPPSIFPYTRVWASPSTGVVTETVSPLPAELDPEDGA